MSNYFKKYIKYKQKYSHLKNMIGGDNYNMIALLWLNKVLGPIEQIVGGKDLNIRQNILKIYNKLKITYQNPNVILFLNFDKIIPEDKEWFRINCIKIADVNQFETIKNNECLDKIYNPSKYNLEHLEKLPIYVQVDMTKILIQYEYMVYENYNYVTFIDLDIKTQEDDLSHVICNPIRPDFTGELYPNKLLDSQTIKILDIFGYLVAGFSYPTEYEKNTFLDKSYNNEIKYNNKPINFIEIDSKIYFLNSTNFENSFLISKNCDNTKKAIKEYFIDYVFCNLIYNNYINNNGYNAYKYDPGFIYTEHYMPFFIYLHLLNKLIYIDFEFEFDFEFNSTKKNDRKTFLHELETKFKPYDDYYLVNENLIKIINPDTFKFFVNKFGFPQAKKNKIQKPYFTSFSKYHIPPDKIKLFLNNMLNLTGEFQITDKKHLLINKISIPYKCIGVEKSKNVGLTKY